MLHRPRFGPVSVSSKAHTLQWAEQASAYHGVVGVVEIRVTAEGNLMSAESSWTQSSFTGMDVGTHSIIWSATQSHIFSKYPEASRVMCIVKLAAPQTVLMPFVAGGHSLGVSFVPVAPPMRA